MSEAANVEYPDSEMYAEEFGLDAEDLQEESGQEGGGEEAQEATEGSESGTEGNQTDEGEEAAQSGSEGGEMPPEERHRQAAARRAREEQERQAAAAAERQAAKDSAFAELFQGQINPYTGRPILSEADYRAYQAEEARQDRQEKLEAAGLDEEVIKSIVDQQTAPMRQQLDAARMAQMQARAEAINRAAAEAQAAAIRNISAEMPEIKTLDDILALPTGGEFNRLVQERGMSIEEAFYLANRQALASRQIGAARAAAANGRANRTHLSGGGNGSLPAEVSRDEVEMYREFNPGAPMEEIRDAYAAERKN